MSLKFIKLIEEAICDSDVSVVLHDVALACKNKGFFKDPNWNNLLISTFKHVQESNDDDVDNIHEISNSFAEETSKFVKKNKNSIGDGVDLDVTTNMFHDSNDSFEIPETQADPPKNDTDDDIGSEGFVAIPDEEIPTNDGSQSPDLLCGVSLFGTQQTNVTHEDGTEDEVLPKKNSKDAFDVGIENKIDFEDADDFDLHDTIDLEMSKLNWDDTTKEDDKSASVTPDLDFDLLSSTKANAYVINPVTSNAESRSEDIDTSAGSNGMEIENNVPNVEATKEISANVVLNEKVVLNVEAENIDSNEQGGHKEEVEMTQLFTKPSLPAKITKNAIPMEEEAMEATQLFAKPKAPGINTKMPKVIVTENNINEHVDHDLNETQLFVKPHDRNGDEIVNEQKLVEANNRSGGEASHVIDNIYDIATQKLDVEKPEADDIYDIATQKIGVKKRRKRNRIISSSDESDEASDEKLVKLNDANRDEVDIYDEATQRFEVQKLTSDKRNNIIPSSDDDDNLLTPMKVTSPSEVSAEEENKSVEVIYEYKTLKSKKYDFLKQLRGSDWSKLTAEANEQQSKIKFVSYFDQCKDLRVTLKRVSSLPSPLIRNDVNNAGIVKRRKENQNENSTDTSDNTRKSARSKAGNSKSTLAQNATSEASKATGNIKDRESRRVGSKMSLEPSSASNSSKTLENSEIMPDFEGFTKSDISGTINNQNKGEEATGMKKEDQQDKKVLPRRQARPIPSTPKEGTRNESKEPLRNLRTNKSVTYSPVSHVLSDENENIKKKSIRDDDSTDVIVNRSRKRKANAVSEVKVLEQTASISDSSLPSSSSRTSNKRTKHFRVMFTMIDSVKYEPQLKEMNISLGKANEAYDALITDRIYRSSKFMCALASGIPIVSTSWLEAIQNSNSVLDPFKFLLNDKDGEAKYKFSLEKTLGKVNKHGGLFQRHSILVTPTTSPNPEILKDIIESGGGKYLKTSYVPRKEDIVLAVSDKADAKMLPQLKKKYPDLKDVISGEGLMQAIFQYNINVKDYKL